jgi:hypothetical protein
MHTPIHPSTLACAPRIKDLHANSHVARMGEETQQSNVPSLPLLRAKALISPPLISHFLFILFLYLSLPHFISMSVSLFLILSLSCDSRCCCCCIRSGCLPQAVSLFPTVCPFSLSLALYTRKRVCVHLHTQNHSHERMDLHTKRNNPPLTLFPSKFCTQH